MAMITFPKDPEKNCFALIGRNLVLKENGDNLTFQDLLELKEREDAGDFFSEPDNHLCALELAEGNTLPSKYKTDTVRHFFATHPEEESYLLARSRALLSWRKDMVYCSCCGTRLEESTDSTSRFCPTCKKIIFPRIEPCVIVLVNRGEEILLARHLQRNQDVYACIAGFMEVGETAEHAVRREILEETGISVKNIHYRGSQSWPFPDQLMLAFTAEYESGEINVQKEELIEAGWFDRNNCPATPQPGSIAYRLIHGLI